MTFWTAALMFFACSEPSYTYGGFAIYDHFPLDGSRSWEYANDDVSVTHKMEIRKSDLTVERDGLTIHEFQHYNDSTGELMRSVQWSSTTTEGVLIHGYQTFDTSGGGGSDTGVGGDSAAPSGGGTLETFDTPVIFGEGKMAPGESVTSSAGSWDFTSTFVGVEGCPNHWVGEDWDSCLHFYLDDGDGDDSVGAPFAGDYWLVPRYGVAWQQTSGDSDVWVLVKANWQSTE